MKRLILPSLVSIVLACSPVEHNVKQDPVPVGTSECPEGEGQFYFAPGVSNQTMDCKYKQWLEAAQNSELVFGYDPEAEERVHFATFLLKEVEGQIGSGWFSKDGKQLTFDEVTSVRGGDKLTFVGGHGLESELQTRGFIPGQQYTVMIPLIYAVAPPEKIIEESEKMDPNSSCLPCEYRSQFGLDFFYQK